MQSPTPRTTPRLVPCLTAPTCTPIHDIARVDRVVAGRGLGGGGFKAFRPYIWAIFKCNETVESEVDSELPKEMFRF